MAEFLLPDLGEGLTDAEIIGWLVSVGDTVRVDQPVVEVETAKASVEVPIPFAGTVTAVFGQPGERVPVGSPLISVAPVESPARLCRCRVLRVFGRGAGWLRHLRRRSAPAAPDALARLAGLGQP